MKEQTERQRKYGNPFEYERDDLILFSKYGSGKRSRNRGNETRQNLPYIPPLLKTFSGFGTQIPPTGPANSRVSNEDISGSETNGLIPCSPLIRNKPGEIGGCDISSKVQHICYVCLRKFKEGEHLEFHEKYSILHRNNLVGVD
jgi:hypothetical protein